MHHINNYDALEVQGMANTNLQQAKQAKNNWFVRVCLQDKAQLGRNLKAKSVIAALVQMIYVEYSNCPNRPLVKQEGLGERKEKWLNR